MTPITAFEPIPASGPLADDIFPRLLLDLYRKKFTGRLHLKRSRTEKHFLFQQGAAVGSESNLPNEWLSAVLEGMGLLSSGDRERVNEEVARKRCKEGVALLALQLIDPKGLFSGLREQLRRRALECFGWVDGDYTVEVGEDQSEEVQPFRMDPYGLVHEGLQAHWSLERMFVSLQAQMALYPRPAKSFPKAMRRLALDATVERMIANLGGNQTLGAVIGAAANSPRAIAAFWLFDAIGVLKYSEDPASGATADDDSQPEIEINIVGEDEPLQAAAQKTGSAAAAEPAAEAAALSPAAEKMRAEVLEKLEKLDSLNYYELLGIKPDADRGALRKAYFTAAKRYHPDAINRLGLHEIRTEAEEVFARIAEANGTLSNDGKRKNYDSLLSGDTKDIDAGVLAQAETFYRKGEILIKMGDFRGALELLQNAVQLYPEESVYQCDLGWAYFKKNPPDAELALQHLREALSLNPNNSVAQVRIGVVDGDG